MTKVYAKKHLLVIQRHEVIYSMLHNPVSCSLDTFWCGSSRGGVLAQQWWRWM